MLTLMINGKTVSTHADTDTPLLWVLRCELQLVGTKYGCGKALCGACTVHVDGVPVRACVTPIATLLGREITTIEGVQGCNLCRCGTYPRIRAAIQLAARNE